MNQNIITTAVGLGLLATVQTSAAAADDPTWSEADQRWQMELLFEPGAQQLRVEDSRERVFIYSELTDTVVDRAVDEQFERIEHMMFVRTVAVSNAGEALRDDDGTVVVSDDGCD